MAEDAYLLVEFLFLTVIHMIVQKGVFWSGLSSTADTLRAFTGMPF